MRLTPLVATAVLLALIAGCTEAVVPAARPVSDPVSIPVPAPAPVIPPQPADWRDWPLTPGTWTYRPAEFGRSATTFGSGAGGMLFEIACDAQARTITLAAVGRPDTRSMTIRTTSATRTLPTVAMAHADAWPPMTSDARLSANDPLIDAMGYSRGRFIVETPGAAALVIPAYAEILRVAEDCRR